MKQVGPEAQVSGPGLGHEYRDTGGDTRIRIDQKRVPSSNPRLDDNLTLTGQQIEAFRRAYSRAFGTTLTDAEASEKAIRSLRLFRAVAKAASRDPPRTT